ncbi:MAG: NAD-dependent epimerase/dehydratase family protein [Bacteroidetes bacterium]|nr:NAD-dependent epimerase/dehydratase family protein [Bacteroidota bacterium]
MKILVTGSAGFIGFHLAKRLVQDGHEVVGLDNLNNYYDVKLKLDRLADAGIESQKIAYNEPVVSSKNPNYSFIQLGIEDAANLERLFFKQKFDRVCHLAAQAGVRYSIKHPEAYIQSNIVGFFNILESCRHHEVKHLVFASSSSVYGDAQSVPFKVEDSTDAPISFYAATKKSNELMAHTYSHLFNLPATGLRFFTVYGPWGRPDMAYSLFTKAILEGKPIQVFNEGKLSRDFTYVDDIVEGIVRILAPSPTPLKPETQNPKPSSPYSPTAPFRVYNIGNSEPTQLMEFITAIEDELGVEAKKEYLPMQPGDVETTYADVSDLMRDFDYKPKTTVREGIARFVRWYLVYQQAGSKVFV